MRHFSWSLALILAGLAPAGHAQQAAQRPAGTISENVTAVLVDVVVRDRRGQPVRDLTVSDFEIFEDGTPQTVTTVTPVFQRAAVAPEAPSTPTATPAAPAAAIGTSPPTGDGPTVAALVFDRLSPEARRLAVQAAQSYVGAREQAPIHIGVFDIDLALTPHAPFTRNAHMLRQALATVASGAAARFNNAEKQQQTANAESRARTAGASAASAIAAGGPGAAVSVGGAPGDAMLAQIEADIARDFEMMERDQQGYSTTNGLFAIINALGELPGRKSLVLFSEGIAIPPAVQRLFVGVIDAANRANVSIYTIDAAGLRTESEQAKIRDRVNEAAAGGGGILSGGAGGGPLTKALEKNEDVLRQDPRTGLSELAQSTGGSAFDNTNNLRAAFSRIDDDLRNYYFLGYTPTNVKYDGRFRTIQVRVKRPGVTVAARKGYFAVRDPGGVAVNTWVAAALGALEQKPVPNAFPVRAGALLFPERGRPGLVPTVVEFSTAPITFQPAADGQTYTSDFTVLVRFVDGQNQIRRTVSQHYEINGPMAQWSARGQGEIIFYREPELSPGVYTMEAVVHDLPSGKSSVRFSTVEVPPAVEGALRMSSIVVVKGTEKIREKDRRPNHPLVLNDVLLHPNIGDPVSKSAKEQGFYFAVYPAAGGAAVDARIELLRNGQLLASVPMPVGQADESGRIQVSGRLPLEPLERGTYDLRAVVTQGAHQMVRSTTFRLIE